MGALPERSGGLGDTPLQEVCPPTLKNGESAVSWLCDLQC